MACSEGFIRSVVFLRPLSSASPEHVANIHAWSIPWHDTWRVTKPDKIEIIKASGPIEIMPVETAFANWCSD